MYFKARKKSWAMAATTVGFSFARQRLLPKLLDAPRRLEPEIAEQLIIEFYSRQKEGQLWLTPLHVPQITTKSENAAPRRRL